MQARYIHDGKALDYTPETDVAAGSVVVVNGFVGITKIDIPAGRPLHVVGVYDVVKTNEEIPLGTVVY